MTKVVHFENMVRQHGFEKAAHHMIGTLIEENNQINTNLKQLNEYIQQKDKVIDALVTVMTGMDKSLAYIAADQYGSKLRLQQLAFGVKVESEAVQGAEASGVNASGNVEK